MIELIFVIVILGILAAVAIPKLAATRDDAKIASIATEAAQAVNDIGAYYTAQGSFGTWGQMTNVKLDTTATLGTSAADDNASDDTVYLGTAGVACLNFSATSDGNLTVVDDNTTDTAVCNGVAAATAKLQTVHVFGGSSVNWD